MTSLRNALFTPLRKPYLPKFGSCEIFLAALDAEVESFAVVDGGVSMEVVGRDVRTMVFASRNFIRNSPYDGDSAIPLAFAVTFQMNRRR